MSQWKREGMRPGVTKNDSSILYICCQNRTYSHSVIIFVYYLTSGSRAKRGDPLVHYKQQTKNYKKLDIIRKIWFFETNNVNK